MAPTAAIHLNDDGESGTIELLPFRCRTLHTQLTLSEPDQRPLVLQHALEIGAEVLVRANRDGDLRQLTEAIEGLDTQSTRIIEATMANAERSVNERIAELTATLQSGDGPFASMLKQFDPAAEGNVIETFKQLVSATAASATKKAVQELAQETNDTMTKLAASVATLDSVAAAEKARAEEAARGHAKGLDHEADTEALLGELVGATGDSLEDVSTVEGVDARRTGDKVITPKSGCRIVIEDKTSPYTENKARTELNAAMSNRDAQLGILIVDHAEKVPGKQPFHFVDDDKVIVVGERYALRVVYALFRAKAIELARVRMVDDDSTAETLTLAQDRIVEIKRVLDRFTQLRSEHTKAAKAIGQAAGYVEDMQEGMSEHLDAITREIDARINATELSAA
jgi:hypothetical protein